MNQALESDRAQEYGDIAAILLDHVERGTTDQAPHTLEVPVANYLDPERWQLEMDRIFLRLPLMLALSVELPHAGDYKALEAVGKPVLITRGRDGRARAFLNACTATSTFIVA